MKIENYIIKYIKYNADPEDKILSGSYFMASEEKNKVRILYPIN